MQRYEALLSRFADSPTAAPVHVIFTSEGAQVRGDVYAILEQPFDRMIIQRGRPDEWFQIALLHLNNKACTSEYGPTSNILTLYNGRNVFESPKNASPLRYVSRNKVIKPRLPEVELRADTGPLGTSNYRITIAAMPVEPGSFLRVEYAFDSSPVSRLLMQSYLHTMGRDTVGFTVVGCDGNGRDEYVRGVRGIVERNAVRYFFAVQAFLEGLAFPEAFQFESSLQRWFDLTEQFPTQLRELERQEYLEAKHREYREQLRLQQAVDAAARMNYRAGH